MDQELTKLVAIIDMSGSMASIADDAIGGFNAFVQSQKDAPGRANLTVVLFNDKRIHFCTNREIQYILPMTREEYIPSGTTALLDALGKTIDGVGMELAATPEEQRPGKVVFTIITDGMENSSREYTRQAIFDKITHQRERYNWEFIFLAANQDAIAEGTSLGILKDNSFNYSNTSKGIHDGYHLLSSRASVARKKKESMQASSTEQDRLKTIVAWED